MLPAISGNHAPQLLGRLTALVIDGISSANTKRAYRRALTDFIDRWNGAQPFNKALVNEYLQRLRDADKSAATINQTLTALKRLAIEARDNGLIDRETLDGIIRIQRTPTRGRRLGQWLTEVQARQLILLPDRTTLIGKRDRVIIALLLECALRREEAISITVDQVQMRDGHHVIDAIKGKGGRLRAIKLQPTVALRIAEWCEAAGITTGRLLRSVDRFGKVGDGLTPHGVYKVLASYARRLQVKIAPHDMRRTFAHLALNNDAPIRQIQEQLGHESIRTTELYLKLGLDLRRQTAADYVVLDEDTNKGE